MPSDNVTISATFSEIALRTVSFDKNCDDEVTGMPENITVSRNNEGKYICAEPGGTPARAGYAFCGWYSDSGLTQKFDFSSEVTSDMTLYAKWEGNVTLTFDPAGGTMEGSTSPVTRKCAPGDKVTIPDAPVRDGYEFLYWEGSQYNPGDEYTVTTEDHTFTAAWKETIPAQVDIDEDSPVAAAAEDDDSDDSDDSSAKKSKGVQTGDEAHLIQWLLLTIAAETGAVYAYRKRRDY